MAEFKVKEIVFDVQPNQFIVKGVECGQKTAHFFILNLAGDERKSNLAALYAELEKALSSVQNLQTKDRETP